MAGRCSRWVLLVTRREKMLQRTCISLRLHAHGKCCIALAVETLRKAGAHACTLADMVSPATRLSNSHMRATKGYSVMLPTRRVSCACIFITAGTQTRARLTPRLTRRTPSPPPSTAPLPVTAPTQTPPHPIAEPYWHLSPCTQPTHWC